MEYLNIILILVVSLSLLNVWLLQYNKSTQWRGGEATTLKEEFAVYGLPTWAFYLIGFLKVSLALLLLIGIWYPVLRTYAAIGLAILLSGSILMHMKIKDPLKRSVPAISLLILCLIIVFTTH